jgi:hypothetical protein
MRIVGTCRFFGLAAILSAATGLYADIAIPTYSYFYTCASGVIDCNTGFQNHNYGIAGPGFPVTGPGPPLESGFYSPVATNPRGESVGFIGWSQFVAPGYESATGQVYCVYPGKLVPTTSSGTCTDDSIYPRDILDDGLYTFNGDIGPLIGSGPDVMFLESALNLPFLVFGVDSILGMNDQDQLLVNLELLSPTETGPKTALGVLSPFAVPEPFSVVLLLTVIAALVVACRWRRRMHAKAPH